MSYHDQTPNVDAHTPYRRIFANATERLGDATAYTADDVASRIKALQDDTKAEYVLTQRAPNVWSPTAGGGGGGGPGSDTTAIHVNTAGEISGIAEKVTPVAADLLVLEDSEAANAKRRIQLTSLGGTHTHGHGTLSGIGPDDHHAEDHAARHGSGGADELDVKALGGFPGGGTLFLRDDGTFQAPPGGASPCVMFSIAADVVRTNGLLHPWDMSRTVSAADLPYYTVQVDATLGSVSVLQIEQAGLYEVTVDYGCDKQIASGSVRLEHSILIRPSGGSFAPFADGYSRSGHTGPGNDAQNASRTVTLTLGAGDRIVPADQRINGSADYRVLAALSSLTIEKVG